MPLKRAFQYYFFQRILRVNSHVPWFVHWSSAVTHPHRIVRASPERPWVGGSIGQYIQAQNGIHFGRNVRLAPGVKIISANHDPLDFDRHLTGPPITIGNDCWIGANAVILPGVQLGDHVIVGAGAVVSKSFPGDCIIGGVPARVIRELEAYAGPSPAIVEFDELGQAC